MEERSEGVNEGHLASHGVIAASLGPMVDLCHIPSH